MNDPTSTPLNKHLSLHNHLYNYYNRDSGSLSYNSIDNMKGNNSNINNNYNYYNREWNDPFGTHQGSSGTTHISPPDWFLLRSSLLEVREPPGNLTNGSKWDKLSCEIWKKFLMHRQTEDIYKKKISLWKFLYTEIKAKYPYFGLYLVGSTLTGFGGNESDVDICLTIKPSEMYLRRTALMYLNTILPLVKSLDYIGKPELIQAKVPILKFYDFSRGLEVDLNCNNSVGIRNTHLLQCYAQLDWRVRPLVIIVKLWAHYHNINDAKNKTISSYSLTLMVIHFLQYGVHPVVLPCLHTEFPNKFSVSVDISKINILERLDPCTPSFNHMSIGELLFKFFDYYSNFNFMRCAISVRRGSTINVEECRYVRSAKNDPHQWKYLCIEEPFDLTNTSRSVYDKVTFDRILWIFRKTAQKLREQVILDSIF